MKRFLLSIVALMGFCTVWADYVDETTHLKYWDNGLYAEAWGFADGYTPADGYALVIPDEVNGLPVIAIQSQAFIDQTGIVSVHIGKNVEKIRDDAFRRSGVESVTFAPDCALKTLGEGVFRGCEKLKEFVMPNTVKTIGNMCFQMATHCTNVVLSNQLEAIPMQAFCNMNSLTTLEIPASVKSVGERAFWIDNGNGGGISNIKIPATVASLSSSIFDGCNNIETIDLSDHFDDWQYYTGTLNLNTAFGTTAQTVLLPPYAKVTVTNGTTKDFNFNLAQDADGYYLISSASDLHKFALYTRANPAANARLTADIVLTGSEAKIGVGTITANNIDRYDEKNIVPYSGTFDGQGHTITLNYTGDNRISTPNNGLFPWTKNATVRNLAVDGNIETTALAVGGIVGGPLGSLTLQSCKTAVNITGISSSYIEMHLGGMVGYTHNADLTLQDCWTSGTIAGGTNIACCAGLVGRITNGSTLTINNCLSQETFDVDNSQADPFWIYDTSMSTDALSGSNNFRVSTDAGVGGGLTHGDLNIVTAVNAEEVADGSVTTALQASRDETVWVQDIFTNAPGVALFANEMDYTVPASGIGTFSAAGIVSLPDGLEAYYTTTPTTTASGLAIKMAQVDGNVPAYTGVLLKGEPGQTYTLTAATSTDAAAVKDNSLVAVVSSTHVDATETIGDVAYTNFALKNGTFYPIAATSSDMKSNKCYLHLPTSVLSSSSQTFQLLFDDDDLTGIATIMETNPSPLGETEGTLIYDLFGRRVDAPVKGNIYIVNDKKIIY